ncbi:MAG: ABC transporter substrate-binding protein [Ruminococcus sp.]|jgi:raffinose/stachyose/melibiose transport system substrate-binding protein|nr:ABC transporter substrate-binding protein [Ruminococcus sp.]
MKNILKITAAVLCSAVLFAGCRTKPNTAAESGTTAPAASKGSVYFLNFKPESDAVYQSIADLYKNETGVDIKIVTAAAGTYETTLKSEIAKRDAPTIFQINGPVGYANWKDYTLDLTNSKLYEHLSDKGLAVSDAGKTYGIPITVEGYGIIYNNEIMNRYFALPDPAVKSVQEITDFDKLAAVAQDMTAKKDTLGIQGVFASTSLAPGEDWRWQTHLANVPLYYEFKNNNIDLTRDVPEITFEYNQNFKNLFDLYLDNSTTDRKLLGSKTVGDSMAEFALGQAAMVQNGNWAYSQVAEVQGNVVKAEKIGFIPLYTGMETDTSQGICIGTENFICVNSQASAEDQAASIDFLTRLYTSEEGKAIVTARLGFIPPFDTFSSNEMPTDPLAAQVMEWSNKTDVENVPWNFTVFPSQTFKDNFGAALLQYAQGNLSWEEVVTRVVNDWRAEKAAAV